ncbi:Uma2 family endonuclease [Streptomyces mirabilis]|uniref:Uma2 family endonuclease n=1 Tax=Streptomyces mirabilis TaxID=68239 RepID=UPI0036DABA84
MTALPDWMRPPRLEGWFAEDLDRLPEAPRHTELIDGALVFMTSPQRWWHGEIVTDLTFALRAQAPAGFKVGREMTIRLDERNRPEPDLLLTTADYDGDRTWFTPDEVRLAEAGIPHYWCVEEEDGAPVVHVYELDKPTRSYAPAGIFRGTLERRVPFEISLDLDKLTPPRHA